MRTMVLVWAVSLLVAAAAAPAASADEEILATVKSVTGEVTAGADGQWKPVVAGDQLREGQIVKTGPSSGASIFFDEEHTAVLGESIQIEISDLLLKTRLEAMKSKIAEPDDVKQVEMQVTPTTGVRGTEQTEEKAEELKREHYWNEGVKQPD